MKCNKCGKEYEDSFKFCPNCAEANPLTIQPPEPSVTEPPVATKSPPVEPPKEKPPKIKLSERAKPIIAKAKEKTNKKTIIIGAVVLLLIIAAIVVPIVLTRPSYPDTITLGGFKQGELVINNLTLKKGSESKGSFSYNLKGTAKAMWSGNATINITLTTSKGAQKEKTDMTVERNKEQEIKESFTTEGPVSKCEVSSIEYDGKMNADDFISIDNVFDGQTLTVGPNVIKGTAKEDCKITFNGHPIEIIPGAGFSVEADIVEGANTLNFEVEVEDGEKCTKTISLTGQITPEQYKASCQPGPGYADLEKNPTGYAGVMCQYKGKVVQAMESGGTTILRVNVTPSGYGFWKDTIYVTYAGTTPAVTDSIVMVYGRIKGSKTYESQAGYTITIPHIEAKYIDVVG